jgi:NAD(P)-dependent dehydrogenase (short-subunit alcohol dehydrogenase family)
MNFFITGGSSGIGYQLVKDLMKMGHQVAFTYYQSKEQAVHLSQDLEKIYPSQKCRAYPLDVRQSEQVDQTAEIVLNEFETIEAVVANAGITTTQLLVSMSDEQWSDVIETNLSGAFFTCRAFLPAMMRNRFGRIIFISSIAQNGSAGQSGYSASKAGLIGLSQSIAKEYGRKGITANTLIAGFFQTHMTEAEVSPANKEFWLKFCPQGRPGQLEEISNVVHFLSSQDSSFINGASIPLTGGLDWMP